MNIIVDSNRAPFKLSSYNLYHFPYFTSDVLSFIIFTCVESGHKILLRQNMKIA